MRFYFSQTLRWHIQDSLSLRFRSRDLEKEWVMSIEPETNWAFLATPIAFLVSSLAQLALLPK